MGKIENNDDEIKEIITDETEMEDIIIGDDPTESVIPAMNVNLPIQGQQPQEENIISDEALLGIYDEILKNIKEDRNEVNELLSNFVNMVINEGDATTSSKEALVNLIKIKNDSADKMTKIADLMTRVKMKERDTFPRYLAANQNNTINISDNKTKRELLKQIEHAAKGKKKD